RPIPAYREWSAGAAVAADRQPVDCRRPMARTRPSRRTRWPRRYTGPRPASRRRAVLASRTRLIAPDSRPSLIAVENDLSLPPLSLPRIHSAGQVAESALRANLGKAAEFDHPLLVPRIRPLFAHTAGTAAFRRRSAHRIHVIEVRQTRRAVQMDKKVTLLVT